MYNDYGAVSYLNTINTILRGFLLINRANKRGKYNTNN